MDSWSDLLDAALGVGYLIPAALPLLVVLIVGLDHWLTRRTERDVKADYERELEDAAAAQRRRMGSRP